MESQITKIRLKKGKIKINAALSAICSSLGLIPSKVVAEFNNVALQVPESQTKFFVNLISNNGTFTVELELNPDSEYIRSIYKSRESKVQKERKLYQYAEKTLDKTGAKTLDKRYAQLLGSYKSFQ